nr:TIGR02611 family protein [Jongsikchunia kroppenstedtii]
MRERPVLNTAYRVSVGVVGTVVLAGGIVAIPYPGPGWLIVFTGLAILASEFAWAHHVLQFVKSKYDRFMAWMSRAGLVIQILFGLFTCAVVLATLWLLDALNLVAGWVGIHWEWLASPLF